MTHGESCNGIRGRQRRRKSRSINVSLRRQSLPKRRQQPMLSVVVASLLASQRDLFCNFPECSDSTIGFVRGWTAPYSKPIRAKVVVPNNDDRSGGHRFSSYYKRKRTTSLCLFDGPSPEDIKERNAIIPTQREATNDYSSNVIDNNNNKGDYLMNPLGDFEAESDDDDEYTRGLWTVGFITLLFATRTPVLKWAFASGAPPPVLLVNASVSLVALVWLLLGTLTTRENNQNNTILLRKDDDSTTAATSSNSWLTGGLELGTWKFLGATLYLNGLALTTASHGALLVQLTTLIVPTTRAIVYKEPAPLRLQLAIGLALLGVVCFVYDPTGNNNASSSLLGDGLCVVAAFCFSAQDIRLYEYGKNIEGRAVQHLVTTKTDTQAFLSIGLLLLAPFSGASSPRQESSLEYLHALSETSIEVWVPVVAALLWIGVVVNAIAPLFQVGGQQILGPTKCQTIYASQPLWAAILSAALLGERLGPSGVVGGMIFLVALVLAATATE